MFSPDGRLLAVSSPRDVQPGPRLYDVATGEMLNHIGGQTHIAFSSDSTLLATSEGSDGTVWIWDPLTGEMLRRLNWNWSIDRLAFIPGGTHVVASNKQTGAQIAWDARTGEGLKETPPFPAVQDPARSPDGRWFARLGQNGIRIVDLRLSEDELRSRRLVMRPDPEWHEAEARRLVQAGEWSAASFHLERYLKVQPEAAAQRSDLALCQLAAPQERAYRQTCATLLEQLEKARMQDRSRLRPLVARAVALQPEAVPADKLLSLAEGADPVTRALLLSRGGKSEDALKLVAGQTDPRALLVCALVNCDRGRPADARKTYEQAVEWLNKPTGEASKTTNLDTLPWDARLQAEVLRREAERRLGNAASRQ
jgi:hypothetical protein